MMTSSPLSPRTMVTPFWPFIRPPMRAPIVSTMMWMFEVPRDSSSSAQNAAQVRRGSSRSMGSRSWMVPVWLTRMFSPPEISPYTVPR